MAETITSSANDPRGEWTTPSISYVEPQRRFCALCGRPIARRYWRAVVEGETFPFCNPAHAEMYTDYWMQVYFPPRKSAVGG